ncbi:MAG: hypothetical protein Q8N89_01480, partial [Azonexus sp.]|nr:hypothetical protein [Azonexus sp.]
MSVERYPDVFILAEKKVPPLVRHAASLSAATGTAGPASIEWAASAVSPAAGSRARSSSGSVHHTRRTT